MKSHKHNQAGFAHVHLLLVLLVVVAITGVGAYVARYQKAKTHNSVGEDAAAASTLTAALPQDLLTVDKVKELAAAEKPSMALQGVELTHEEGTYVYKVKLADGSVLVFNARSGTKVTKPVDTELEGETNIPANVKPVVDFNKAREVALAQKPGGVIQNIELEFEDGKLVYSIRFTDKARVDVNAADGSVVSVKPAQPSQQKSGGTGSTQEPGDKNKTTTSGGGSSNSGSSSSSGSGSGSSGSTSGSGGSGSGQQGADDGESHSGGSSDDSSGHRRP